MIKCPTTSPDITCRTYVSGSTVPWRWTLILASGHEIRTSLLPSWRDHRTEVVTDVDGREWTLKAGAVIAYRREGP